MTSAKPHELESRSEALPSGGGQLWALAWTNESGERTVDEIEEVRAIYGTPDSRLWIDVEDPDKDTIDQLGALLGLHPLVSEDILEQDQRAKIEETPGALHIVMFALTYNGELVPHEIDLVLGERFLLTAHDKDINLRNAPFTRRDPSGHLAAGPDFALWMITDWLVDGYFPIFDKLGDEIDTLEAEILRRPGAWVVERLFAVRRDLLKVRHAVLPQREVFNQLTNRDLKLIHPDRIVYFRDVYDHLIRLTDELDSYRELVSTALDIYLSQVNNNLSEVMKRLTSVTAVLAGAGALAGIFGMSEAGLAISFEDMRFWLVTVGIVILSSIGILYFRRIGWI
ncbi:MAG TPA: magnesium transporter CorA family protein [Candidatus Limnocylindrales bacterium]|nr:magnesium transporter CorA family protein [Candidatus Limnocylindrales bacterium]